MEINFNVLGWFQDVNHEIHHQPAVSAGDRDRTGIGQVDDKRLRTLKTGKKRVNFKLFGASVEKSTIKYMVLSPSIQPTGTSR